MLFYVFGLFYKKSRGENWTKATHKPSPPLARFPRCLEEVTSFCTNHSGLGRCDRPNVHSVPVNMLQPAKWFEQEAIYLRFDLDDIFHI